jgi:hypothetical protein
MTTTITNYELRIKGERNDNNNDNYELRIKDERNNKGTKNGGSWEAE